MGLLQARLSADLRCRGNKVKLRRAGATQEWNSAQNKLGLAPGRFVPHQVKAPLPDRREDARRCASRVEARGYEDIRVDDNPFHSDFIHRKLAKVSRKILTEQKLTHLSLQSAWGHSGNRLECREPRPGTGLQQWASPAGIPVYVRCVGRRPTSRSSHG